MVMMRTFDLPLTGLLLLSISLAWSRTSAASICAGGDVGNEEAVVDDIERRGGRERELCANNGGGVPTNHDDDDGVDPADLNLRRAGEFRRFLQKIFDISESYGGNDRTEQEGLVLRGVLDHVGMDPALLGLWKEDDGGNGDNNDQRHHQQHPTTMVVEYNWYEELHRRIDALAPMDCFFITYHGRPTPRQVELVAAMDHDVVQYATDDRDGSIDDKILRLRAFRPFRHRGGVANVAHMFQLALYNPLRYWIGFAIPNDEILDRIAAIGRPVVEVGAGTGYWTATLRATRGVDAVAYDAEPPTRGGDNNNVYFHHTYTEVRRGTCDTIFSPTQKEEGGGGEEDRVLLIVWPNCPDNVDNHPSFGSPELGETWDTECLESYLGAGGRTVIYVGEREENVPLNKGAPRDVGLSATKRFQEMLQAEFTMKERIEIPNWWYSDDATIWERRKRN